MQIAGMPSVRPVPERVELGRVSPVFERQLVEVPFLVGHYHMVAFTLNTLGVEREDGVPDLPSA